MRPFTSNSQPKRCSGSAGVPPAQAVQAEGHGGLNGRLFQAPKGGRKQRRQFISQAVPDPEPPGRRRSAYCMVSAQAAPLRSQSAARGARAFTLLEMIVVIGIIGIMAALALPSLKMNKGNVMSAATRQLMDDLALARLRAINGRTIVYVVFFDTQSYYIPPAIGAMTNYFGTNQAANLLIGSQYTTYALFTRHSIGDQPGTDNPRYMSEWKTLPEGVFIATNAFTDPSIFHNLTGSPVTNVSFQFPSTTSPYSVPLVFLAFDSQGKLYGRTGDVRIPLTVGSIFYRKDPTGRTNIVEDPDVMETPAGNWTNNPNYVRINWLTGRCKVDRLELP